MQRRRKHRDEKKFDKEGACLKNKEEWVGDYSLSKSSVTN